MYSLLALIFFLNPSHAQTSGTVSTSVSQDSFFQLKENSKKNSQVISLKSAKILQTIILSVDITNEKTDSSNKTLTTQSGQAIPLSSIDNGQRQIMNVGVELQTGSLLTSISTAQDILPTIYARRSYSLLMQKSLYSGATQISAQLAHSLQNQPESYFINPLSLQSQKRLALISNNNLILGIEQILTENIRSQFQYTESHFENYRPMQRSLKLAASFAFDSRWTSRLDIGYAAEDKNVNLFDDRGYFQAQWMDNQLSYEWKLDSFIGLGWSTVLENEIDPRRNYSAHLGTDTLGLFIDQRFKAFSFGLKLAQTQTSESQSGLSASGVFSWDI